MEERHTETIMGKATQKKERDAGVKCAAFLRGINVGGNKIISMAVLKKAFEKMGFANARTLLASGNVVFESLKAGQGGLSRKIEDALEKTFGHEIGVVVRTEEELRELKAAEVFKGIEVTPATRLYVTFRPDGTAATGRSAGELSQKDFEVLRVTAGDVCSVLTVKDAQTVKLMAVLDKEFGKRVTTRNWNTIEKVLRAFEN